VALDQQARMSSIGSGSGSGWGDSVPAEQWYARIQVSPGTHTVRATSTGPSLAVTGELLRTIDCKGDQLFVVHVASQFQKATSFFSRAQLTGDIQVFESADAVPSGARAILFHGAR
jgi:hypothetical protein